MELLLCPYIRRAWYSLLEPGAVIHNRVIFDYELMYLKKGQASIMIGDQLYHATPGDLFLFRPKQPHAIYVSPNEEMIQPHIHFDLQYYDNRAIVPVSYDGLSDMTAEQLSYFREDILDQFFSPFPSYLRPHNGLYIEQLLFDIIHATDNPRPFNDVYLQHAFLKLWEQVLMEASYTSRDYAKKESAAVLIKQLIERNDSRALTLDEITQALHFSKSYIARVFQESYGISPLNYHTTLRVQKAKRMIQFTNMSLSQIAVSVGFESLQNFSRVFKKLDGCPPSNYRKVSPADLAEEGD